MSFPNQDRRKKLTPDQVREIRDLWRTNNTIKDLALLFGMSPTQIGLIVSGHRRKQVSAHG